MNIEVSLQPDKEGFTGRQCPSCRKYFKITTGTGLPNVSGHICPYCGTKGDGRAFLTKGQSEYLRSIAMHHAEKMLFNAMKKLERRPKPNAPLSISITVRGQPSPIRRYSEKELEEIVTCSDCTLRYAIYGSFAYCPDCGRHNSLQILLASLDVTLRLCELADREAPDISHRLIENALEDAVAGFDGFGRETCRVASRKAIEPKEAGSISFQNITAARSKILGNRSAPWRALSRDD